MKQRIRACRVVLTSGDVIMDYIDIFGNNGLAFAGRYNNVYDKITTYSASRFEEHVRAWEDKLKDCEDVEYIEFI